METNDDAPEDVKRATPVKREIKRGEKDDTFEGYPRIQEKKHQWEHCDKPSPKKKQREKNNAGCCRGRKEKEKRKTPTFTTVAVFGEPCTFPKLDIVPRHCLTKKSYIDMLATPSRKCPPDCQGKKVRRRLRPISERIKELAQPTRQRMLLTLQEGATKLPAALLDNLVKTLENETCLTPEQAASLSRKKKVGKKKRIRGDAGLYKEPHKVKKPSIGAVNTGTLDRDAVSCQYLMAERFVKSILKWKCPIPKTDFTDIARVVTRRLIDTLEYTPPQDEDRKSQQLRFLSDIIACWISGILTEVAKDNEKELEERCKKKEEEKKALEEEEEEEEWEEDAVDKDKERDWDEDEDEDEDEGKDVKDKGEEGAAGDKAEDVAEGTTTTDDEVETQVGDKGPEEEMEEEQEEATVTEAEPAIVEESAEVAAEAETEAAAPEAEVPADAGGEPEAEQVTGTVEPGAEAAGGADAETAAGAETATTTGAEAETVTGAEAETATGAEAETTTVAEANAATGAEAETATEIEAQKESATEDQQTSPIPVEDKAVESETVETKDEGIETLEAGATEADQAESKAEGVETADPIAADTETVEATTGETSVLEKQDQETEALREPAEGEQIAEAMETEKPTAEDGQQNLPEVEEEKLEDTLEKPAEVTEEPPQIETPQTLPEREEPTKKESPKGVDDLDGLDELFKTELPFLTFGKIIDTVYKMVESAPENDGRDPLTNGIHRAIYEKLGNIVALENPELLTEELKDVMDVVCGKIATWLRTILTRSQIAFMERYMPEVESKEVRDWTKWLIHISEVAKDWNAWLRGTIEKILEMQGAPITRGEWHDWTKSVDSGALLWRRFHLQTIHQAHRNITMVTGRRVVKTGTKRLPPDLSEQLIRTTSLDIQA